jgi:hypothetical protein
MEVAKHTGRSLNHAMVAAERRTLGSLRLATMAACGVNRSIGWLGRYLVAHFSTFADGAPWFVVWGTLALINAALAQGRNRSGLLWFALSVVFGPLATLLLVLLPKVRSRLF